MLPYAIFELLTIGFGEFQGLAEPVVLMCPCSQGMFGGACLCASCAWGYDNLLPSTVGVLIPGVVYR